MKSGFQLVGILLLALALPAAAQQGPILAVFDMQDRGSKLGPEVLGKLTDYLSVLLTEGGYQVIPRDQLKARLMEQKKQSYKSCFDKGCQVELGRELAAQKTLSTQVFRIGKQCRMTATLYDLQKAATEKAASVKAACTEDALGEALELMSAKLTGQKRDRFDSQEAKRKLEEEARLKSEREAEAARQSELEEERRLAEQRRIEEDRRRREEGARPGAVQPPPPVVRQAAPPLDEGWANGGGYLGIVSGVAVLGLSIGSDMTQGDLVTSMSLGGAATLLFGILAPVVESGSTSAREGANVPGSPWLRVAGWTSYGVALSGAIIMLGLGAGGEVEFTSGEIIIVGALGGLSLGFFAGDAFVAAGQASDKQESRRAEADSFFQWAPMAVPFVDSHGDVSLGLGLGGRF